MDKTVGSDDIFIRVQWWARIGVHRWRQGDLFYLFFREFHSFCFPGSVTRTVLTRVKKKTLILWGEKGNLVGKRNGWSVQVISMERSSSDQGSRREKPLRESWTLELQSWKGPSDHSKKISRFLPSLSLQSSKGLFGSSWKVLPLLRQSVKPRHFTIFQKVTIPPVHPKLGDPDLDLDILIQGLIDAPLMKENASYPSYLPLHPKSRKYSLVCSKILTFSNT